MSIDVVSTASRAATVAEPAQFANTTTSSMKVRVVSPVAARLRFAGPFEAIDLVDSDYPLIANVPEVFHLDVSRALHVGSLTDDVSIDFAVVNIHGGGSSVTVVSGGEGGSSGPVEWEGIEGKPDGIDTVVGDVVDAKSRADQAHLLASQGISRFVATDIESINAVEPAISEGTLVTTTSDGKRYQYTFGNKNVLDSYILLADITPEWAALQGVPSGLDYVVERVDGLGTIYDLGSQPISQFTTYTGGSPYAAGFLVRASAPGYEFTNINAWFRYVGGDPNSYDSYAVISTDAVSWTEAVSLPTAHPASRPILTSIPEAVRALPKNDTRTSVPYVSYQIVGDMSAYREVVLRFSVKGQLAFNPEETIAYVDINLNGIPLPFNFTGADLEYALNDAIRRRTFETFPPYPTAIQRFVDAALDFPLFEWRENFQQLRFWAPANAIEREGEINVVTGVAIEVMSGPDIIADCWNLVSESFEERRFPLGADAILSSPSYSGGSRRRTVLTHLRDVEKDVTALVENGTTLVIVDSVTGFIQIPGEDAVVARSTNLLSIGFSDGDTIDFYSNIGSFDTSLPPDVSFIVNPGSTVGDLLDFYFPGIALDLVPSPISGWLLRVTQLSAAAVNGVEMMLVWNQSIFGAGLPQFGIPGYGSEQPLRGEIIQASTDDEHVASEVEVPLPYINVGAPVDKGNVKSKLLRILAALTDGATARLATIIKGPYTATQQIQSGGLRYGSQFLVSDLGVTDGDVFTITTATAGDFTLAVTPTVTLEEFVWFVNNTLGEFGIEQKAHVRLSPRLQRLIAAWQVEGAGDFPVSSAFGDGVAKIFA